MNRRLARTGRAFLWIALASWTVQRQVAGIDDWLRDIAPSNELRHWYHSHLDQWPTFRSKYLKELARPEYEEALRRFYELARRRNGSTLLFASKNETHNNADRAQGIA